MASPGPVNDLKAFVPAKDFVLASQFYLDLGFERRWGSAELAAFEIGAFRFLLQNFYVEQWAANCMMHLMVENTEHWWAHLERIGLRNTYPGVMAKPPTVQPWGLRVLYLSDPSGVLWHIADHRV